MRNEEGNNYITDYSYDKNGNQLTKVKSESWLSTTKKQRLGIKTASELSGSQSSEYFTYNVFNQLKEYRDTEGTSAKYEYMPNNYRYEKTVGGVKTRFLWDGDYVIGELDSTGNISKKYFYGKDMISDNSGNNYVYDIHGSVTNVLNSSGTKTETYEYNAFGNVENVTGSTAQPWQYCGEYKDSETGLIYLRNRYYDPEMGRFISVDPIRDGLNWYSYCGGNPVMFMDLSGLFRIINGESYDKYEFGSGNIDNKVDDYVSKDIKKMQVRLQELGYLDKNITDYGYFGKKTIDAVNKFKNDNGIKNDTNETRGVVGATTWAYLGLDFDVMESYNYTNTNVTFTKGAMHVDVEKSNFQKPFIETLYGVAENIKAAYKLAYGSNINISTKSVYIELLGHLSPNLVSAKYYQNSSFWLSIKNHTDVIDIGESSVDSNRWVWDTMVGECFD